MSTTLENIFETLTDKASQSKTLGVQERLWKLAHVLVPDHGPTNSNLGGVYLQAGYIDEAIKYLECGADNSTTLGNLGAAYIQQGDMERAGQALEQSLKHNPEYVHALSNLGHVYRSHMKNQKALDCYKKAFELKPDNPAFVINIANALTSMGELEEATKWLNYGIEQFPKYTEFHNNLGNILNKKCEPDKAIEAYQYRLDQVDCVSAAANKVLVNLYRNDNNPWQQREIAKNTMQVLDKIDRLDLPQYNHDRPRVGFLSAHFGKHPVGFFTTGLFVGNDELDYYVYSNRYDEDEITKIVKGHTNYKSIHGMSEEQVCQQIMRDEIDILVDCGGLSGKNHITIFKRKPAPVQIGWVGYAGTRGLKEIDYFLTDWYHTPKGYEDHFTEEVIRMPDDYVTYFPPDIPIKKKKRPFTFIAAHNGAKINDKVLSLWGRVLQKTPDTRLLMAYSGLKANERRIKEFLDSYGIDRNRIEIHDRLQHTDMMELYNRADLCLDTVPYASGLVACESLWMGVPVVTMPNDMFSGRHAMAHLKNLDMDEFICYSEREYIEKAAAFTTRKQSEFLPMYIRENMTMSPLLNYEKFAHDMNAKFWEVWK